MNFRRQGYERTVSAISLASLLMLGACGERTEVTDSPATPAENTTPVATEIPLPPPSPLLGSWKGKCEKNSGSTSLIGTYRRESHVFTGSQVKTHIDFFDDEKCSVLEARATYSGSYSTPDGTDGEAKPIDLIYEAVTLRPVTSTGSDVLHWLNICGIGAEWERERELEVTEVAGDEKCLDRSKGAIYTVHALKEAKLYIGAFDVRRNPETRAQELLETPFTR